MQPNKQTDILKSNRASFLFFFLIVLATQHVGSYFPDQGSTPYPLDWNHGALTTGLSEKSLQLTCKVICARLTSHIVE